jgi:hypothetical protein
MPELCQETVHTSYRQLRPPWRNVIYRFTLQITRVDTATLGRNINVPPMKMSSSLCLNATIHFIIGTFLESWNTFWNSIQKRTEMVSIIRSTVGRDWLQFHSQGNSKSCICFSGLVTLYTRNAFFLRKAKYEASRQLLACMDPTLTWVLPNKRHSLFCFIVNNR